MADQANALTFIYKDEWSRSVYKKPNGTMLVDVDGELHTMTDCGEPCCPTGRKTPETQ